MRIGIVSWTATYWPLFLMARDSPDVELHELGSTRAGVDALLEGSVDIAATCPDELIAAGAPLPIAAGLVSRPPGTLVAAPAVRTFGDLRGKRIAVTQARGSVSVFLRALLRERGLGPTDYEPVVVGPTPAQAAALEHGKVDAAMLTFPFDAAAAARGFTSLVHVGDALGPCAFATLNVRAAFTASPAWRSFHAVYVSAVARLANRAGRARETSVLADATGVRIDSVPESLAFDTAVDPRGLARLLAFMRAEGLGDSLRAPSAYIEASEIVEA